MTSARSLARTLLNLAVLPLGLIGHAVTGRTATWAHDALIQLFCATGGRTNDWVSRLLALRSRRLGFPGEPGLLGSTSGPELDAKVAELRDRGYVVFPAALPSGACERLMNFALQTPAQVRRMDDEPVRPEPRVALFDPASPLAVRYDYAPDKLLANSDVQALLADPSLLALAQAYLDCRPKADVLSMWWHTSFHSQPDSEAAQYYHFDMDRIKWLKIFVYLTNVGPADGPHSFIEGSHRTGGIPQSMLRRGYVRLSDEEVLGHYGDERQIEFSAPRGTVIVEDTRGLHKGKAVTGASRLVLQLQFSNSLFGARYAKAKMSGVHHPALQRQLVESPDVYANYL